MRHKEFFISVDIETSGPIPGEYDLLNIGACVTDNQSLQFESIIKPLTGKVDIAAMTASGIDYSAHVKNGEHIVSAMQRFLKWINEQNRSDLQPVFVGFNAPFDWSFVNYCFIKHIDFNPFGFTALDIKSLYMGKYKTSWDDTRSSKIDKKFNLKNHHKHDALKDAIYQSEIFNKIISSSLE